MKKIDLLDIAKKLEGRQTLDSISSALGIKKSSCLNVISKLKKEGYLTKTGGRQQKRIYTISAKIQKKGEGMFDILNQYAKEKIAPPFIHIAHLKYSIEYAIVDLMLLNNIRINLALLPLFSHVKDWNKLYKNAKKAKLCRNLGLLYDLARSAIRAKKMPDNIYKRLLNSNLFMRYEYGSKDFKELSKKWRLNIPFDKKDII